MQSAKHYLAKIEGHGEIKIDFVKNRAFLIIEEGERLFEQIVVGRSFNEAAFITARICGICPTAHTLAALFAVEDALGIQLNELILTLRRILLLAQAGQSHTLHLFFLSLPDWWGVDNILSLDIKEAGFLDRVTDVKHFFDKIIRIFGGRAIHPVFPIVGGTTKIPSDAQLQELQKELPQILETAKWLAQYVEKIQFPEIEFPTCYLALVGDTYLPFSNIVQINNEKTFEVADYTKYIQETTPAFGNAKFSRLRQGCGEAPLSGARQDRLVYPSSDPAAAGGVEKPNSSRHFDKAQCGSSSNNSYLVGALGRVLYHNDKLSLEAQKLYQNKPPRAGNSFYNNWAQMIEIVHCLETINNLLPTIAQLRRQPPRTIVKPRAGEGRAVVEAPRGLLYHQYRLADDGKITSANIITPTASNLTNIESDINNLLKSSAKLPDAQQTELVERLIRAYDPCITCSVH